MNWDLWYLFWAFLIGYLVGVLHMAHRSNIDSATTRQ